MIDLLGDHTTNTAKQILGGQSRFIPVTSPAHLDALPEIPTAEEGGLPGLQIGIWRCVYAPKGTPRR